MGRGKTGNSGNTGAAGLDRMAALLSTRVNGSDRAGSGRAGRSALADADASCPPWTLVVASANLRTPGTEDRRSVDPINEFACVGAAERREPVGVAVRVHLCHLMSPRAAAVSGGLYLHSGCYTGDIAGVFRVFLV